MLGLVGCIIVSVLNYIIVVVVCSETNMVVVMCS